MPNRADILKQKFQDSLALPFEQVLPEAVIQKVLKEQGVSYRQTLYTPIVTLWAWMSQVLDSDKSLSNAVSRVIAWERHRRTGCSLSGYRSLQRSLANAYPCQRSNPC